MSMIARQSTPVPVSKPRPARTSWAPLIVTAALTVVLLGASGFLSGTLQGDMPWPATPAEQTVYDTGRALMWGGVTAIVVGTIAATALPPTRAGGGRWLWGMVTLVGSIFLGGVVFLSVFGLAQTNYAFVLTS